MQNKCAFEICGFSSEDEFKDALVKLQEDGLTKAAMAAKLRIGTSTVDRMFRKFGLDRTTNHLLCRICGFEDKASFDGYCVNEYSEGSSIREIANKLGASYISLRQYFVRNKFNIRTQSGYIGLRFKGERFTSEELEVINGCLLGDGSLYQRKYTSSLSYRCKHKSICKSLSSSLPRLYRTEPRRCSYVDKRTNKEYVSYQIDSISNFHFHELRQKWYPNGKKIIPRDLVLTPETCYWWYLGDGSSGNNSLVICTNGFAVSDVEFLLSIFPVKAQLYIQKNKKTNKEYPMISITSIENRLKFLNFIGRCRHKEYNYRWIVHSRREAITAYCYNYDANAVPIG